MILIGQRNTQSEMHSVIILWCEFATSDDVTAVVTSNVPLIYTRVLLLIIGIGAHGWVIVIWYQLNFGNWWVYLRPIRSIWLVIPTPKTRSATDEATYPGRYREPHTAWNSWPLCKKLDTKYYLKYSFTSKIACRPILYIALPITVVYVVI